MTVEIRQIVIFQILWFHYCLFVQLLFFLHLFLADGNISRTCQSNGLVCLVLLCSEVYDKLNRREGAGRENKVSQ